MSTLRQIKGNIFTSCARSRVQNLKWGLPPEQFDKWYGLEWLGCEAGAGSTPGTLSIFGQRERAVAKWARLRHSYHLCFPPSRHDHVQRQASQPEMWVWVCVTHWQACICSGWQVWHQLDSGVSHCHFSPDIDCSVRDVSSLSGHFSSKFLWTHGLVGGSLWHKAAPSSLAPNLCPWFLIYFVSTYAFASCEREK